VGARLTPAGNVVFHTRLYYNRGAYRNALIWSGVDGSTAILALSGDAIDVNGVMKVIDSVGSSFWAGAPLLTDTGQVALTLSFTDGSSGVFCRDGSRAGAVESGVPDAGCSAHGTSEAVTIHPGEPKVGELKVTRTFVSAPCVSHPGAPHDLDVRITGHITKYGEQTRDGFWVIASGAGRR